MMGASQQSVSNDQRHRPLLISSARVSVRQRLAFTRYIAARGFRLRSCVDMLSPYINVLSCPLRSCAVPQPVATGPGFYTIDICIRRSRVPVARSSRSCTVPYDVVLSPMILDCHLSTCAVSGQVTSDMGATSTFDIVCSGFRRSDPSDLG
jgi:hypothetical protein